MVCRTPLDSDGDNFLGALVGLVSGAGLDLLDLHRRLMGHLGLHLGDQIFLCILHGEAGDFLQHLRLAVFDLVNFLPRPVGLLVLMEQGLFFPLDILCFPVQILLFLLQAAFLLLQVGPAALFFLLIFAAAA